VEYKNPGKIMKPVHRISLNQLATAIRKVRSMSLAEKSTLIDEISRKQPNLLASCLVQQQLGVAEHATEFLLNILLVCFQAMKESDYEWPLISEEDQERQLVRLRGAVAFSEDLTDPDAANAARTQYVMNHPEAPLLAFVVREFTLWLLELADRGAEAESDKFVMVAGINIVNCIAHAQCPGRA
jgi:hypothetical protein